MRDKECKKKCHSTREGAIDFMMRKFLKNNKGAIRPYWCNPCGAWHLTSWSEDKLKQITAENSRVFQERLNKKMKRREVMINREAQYWSKKLKLNEA